MIVFDIPKVILQSREKVKIFNFLDFDHVWSLWTLYVCSGDMYVLLRHGICCMDMGHVFLWEKNMSSCWRRVGVFLLEKNMSSCWRRIYGYGRCLLVGEEYMGMLLKTFQGALRLAAGAFFLEK